MTLFDPITIGAVTAKNRIAVAATSMGAHAPDGSITDQVLCRYVALAKGGAGWITVEHSTCTDKYGIGILCFHSDRQLRGLRDLSDVIHAYKAIGIVQLGLGHGRQGNPARLGTGIVAPSPEPYRVKKGTAPRGLRWLEQTTGAVPRQLSPDEIETLEDLFVDSAARIQTAGFNGIEIHGGHGYLIAQFLSPLSNLRTDAYGGSFEKRLRLPLNLIRKARKRLGNDFVIGYRISGDEHVTGGLTLDDTKRIVPILVSEGLDFVHLSSGRIEALGYLCPEAEGVILPEAESIKSVSKVPVICPNIHTPALAETVIKNGRSDMVSLCRALIADPEWPNKVRDGRQDEITQCIRCNTCIKSLWQLLGTRCTVNPTVGKERFIPDYFPPVETIT
jgi:2,4-dienoyl-CoA reductase-like NADH-dependent reductase (Old Yellow Enzyme family)